MSKLGVDLKHVRESKPRKSVAEKTTKKKKRSKPMATIVEEIYRKNKNTTMKVVDIKKELLTNKRGYKQKEKKLYTLITIALNQSKKFQKAGPGEYKLVAKKSPKIEAGKKKSGKRAKRSSKQSTPSKNGKK